MTTTTITRPESGQVWRSAKGRQRRVVSVEMTGAHTGSYYVDWEKADNLRGPRSGRSWCSTWLEFAKELVSTEAPDAQ